MSNRTQRADALRVIDANANRAFEGLRTLEEIARFVMDDAQSSANIKELRHKLQSTLQHVSLDDLLQSRSTANDVGTEIKTEGELTRASIGNIAAAASQRVQQSLRVIEEFAKIVNAEVSRQAEQIRYASYDVFARLQLSMQPNALFLLASNLYLLTDCSLPLDQFAKQMRELSLCGVDLIQIREKSRDDRCITEYVKAAIASVQPDRTKIIVNDRVDIALLCGADGVHVGQGDLACSSVKKYVGSRLIVGVSTHDNSQIDQAIADGADYIGCGPTFESPTKSFEEYPGLEFLKSAAQQSTIPAFAVGGIDLENLSSVLQTGITRVAISSGILLHPVPLAAAKTAKWHLKSNLGVQ